MTSAELLDLFNRLTGRPKADAITDATKYKWLKEAQDEVISEVASVAPKILYQKVGTGSMPALLTTDQNVFTFGVDTNGDPVVPFGAAQIYKNLSDIPDRPLRPDWDYIDEGSQIRLPRNRKYAGALYWRGVVFPLALDAGVGHAPALIPGPANKLTAIRAAKNFGEAANRNPTLVATMALEWNQQFPKWCLLWKKQFSYGGALRAWSLKDLVTPLN
jgi:hypothetical protein